MIPDSIKGNSKRVYKGGREKSKRMGDTKKKWRVIGNQKKRNCLRGYMQRGIHRSAQKECKGTGKGVDRDLCSWYRGRVGIISHFTHLFSMIK